MTLIRIFVLLLVLLTPAAADCGKEADTAEQSLVESGPFHIEHVRINTGTFRRNLLPTRRDHYCGKIIPGKAEELFVCNSSPSAESFEVSISSDQWEKDEYGWRKPNESYVRLHDKFLPIRIQLDKNKLENLLPPKKRESISCLEKSDIQGARLKIFTSRFKISDIHEDIETIVFNLDKKQVVELEKSQLRRGLIRLQTITKYRFNSFITIEKPEVESETRKKLSQAAFRRDKFAGDAACRARFEAAVEKSSTQKFHFTHSKRDVSHGGETAGTFQNMSNFVIRGAPEDKDITLEIGRIGEFAWSKFAIGKFSKLKQIPIDDDQLLFFQSGGKGLLLSTEKIGFVECSPSGKRFTFNQFELREAEMHMLIKKVAELNSEGLIALVFEGMDLNLVETRTYDPTISITAPLFP